ncbi:MAG: ribonuclease P protein component [Bacteroidales bacterium]|jgi:ribonuclease P protein component|nr:ribonuclease P protein component [Bacteroidales bacterium]
MAKFPKSERLSSQKIIDNLFLQGEKFISYPFSVRFMVCEGQKKGVDVLLVAPKRHIKKAVDRNRIKRLLREAYRLQKTDFIASLNLSDARLHISVSLIKTTELDFEQTKESMAKILSKITALLQDNEDIKADI